MAWDGFSNPSNQVNQDGLENPSYPEPTERSAETDMVRPPFSRSRSGIATLEYVLVFPMLLAMAAALFVMGRAILRKEVVASTARKDAWQKRPSAQPGEPLQLNHNPVDSAVDSTATKPVSLGKIFPGQTNQAESRATVTAHPWAKEDLPFAPGQGILRVHGHELDLLGDNLGSLLGGSGGAMPRSWSPGGSGSNVTGALSAIVSVFGFTLDPGTNPLMIAASVAGRIANPVVRLAAGFLDGPVAAVVRVAKAVCEAILALLGWFDRDLARKLHRVINMFDIALDAFHNLEEASQGRLGNWSGNMADRLRGSIP
jgi:hypothetical protein